MATYTMYWPDWMCDRSREQGLEGRPLRMLWGGHNQDTRFSRFRVAPGDTVVPVTCEKGVLYALASLEVAEKTTADLWLAKHPADTELRLHGCGSELLVGVEGKSTPLRFDRAFSGKQLAKWRYDGTDGERPLKFLEDGVLKKAMSLQGVYRLTPATAKLVAAVLSATRAEAPKSTASDLEALLRDAPSDEKLARVLADALQEGGDVRGEILVLELDLAHEEDPARAVTLDARHAALMRTAVALKKKPGGFPYRMLMGSRTYAEMPASGITLRAADDESVLRAFESLSERLLDARGFGAIEIVREARIREPPPEVARRFDAAGARRTSFLTWKRKKPFSVEEAMRLTRDGGAFVVTASGPVRAIDAGPVLPFQATSQWLRSPPDSELRVVLGNRTVRGMLRVPLGSQCAETRVVELRKLLGKLGAAPIDRRMVRTATGDTTI